MKKNFLGIDWESRKGNKMFWLALLSALIILSESILKPFGISFDFAGFEANIASIIEALFGVLIVVGVVMNPQEPGVTDKGDSVDETESEDVAG